MSTVTRLVHDEHGAVLLTTLPMNRATLPEGTGIGKSSSCLWLKLNLLWTNGYTAVDTSTHSCLGAAAAAAAPVVYSSAWALTHHGKQSRLGFAIFVHQGFGVCHQARELAGDGRTSGPLKHTGGHICTAPATSRSWRFVILIILLIQWQMQDSSG